MVAAATALEYPLEIRHKDSILFEPAIWLEKYIEGCGPGGIRSVRALFRLGIFTMRESAWRYSLPFILLHCCCRAAHPPRPALTSPLPSAGDATRFFGCRSCCSCCWHLSPPPAARADALLVWGMLVLLFFACGVYTAVCCSVDTGPAAVPCLRDVMDDDARDSRLRCACETRKTEESVTKRLWLFGG